MEPNKKIALQNTLSNLMADLENYDRAILTACIGYDEHGNTVTKEDNQERNRILSAALLTNKYAVAPIHGGGLPPHAKAKEQAAAENSFLVVNIHDDADFVKSITQLGKEFLQDAVLIQPKNEPAYLHGTTDNTFAGIDGKQAVENIALTTLQPYLTAVKNTQVVFEHIDTKEWIGRYAISLSYKEYQQRFETKKIVKQ